MKKILFLLLVILNINYVCALEKEISHIEYKWYIEEMIDTKYIPKKDNLSGYYEDTTDIEYSPPTQWNKSYCEYNKENYLIEEYATNKYKRPVNTRYIILNTRQGIEGVRNYKTIKIFDNDHEINYITLINNENLTKLELDKEYNTIYLHFYIDTELNYTINLYNNTPLTKLALSYSVNSSIDGKTLYPTKEWINENTVFVQEGTTGDVPNSPLIKDIDKDILCRVKEINTLRYKIQKKYYDDDYHTYIEGYIPDIKECVIYYKDTEEKEEIEKEVIEPKIETKTETKLIPKIETKIKTIKEKIYEYLKPEKETIYKDKIKYIHKKVIPKTIYIVIIILLFIIIIQAIKILFKNGS